MRAGAVEIKLPNAQRAVVEQEKIVDYLLNLAHRYGANNGKGSRNR
jgi:hypothetical protein